MDVLKWGAVAYVCGILAVVAYGVMRSLSSDEYRAHVAQVERELAGPQDAPQPQPQPQPQPEPEPDMQPWGALFSVEQQTALIAVQQSGAAHARRRMERATQEAR